MRGAYAGHVQIATDQCMRRAARCDSELRVRVSGQTARCWVCLNHSNHTTSFLPNQGFFALQYLYGRSRSIWRSHFPGLDHSLVARRFSPRPNGIPFLPTGGARACRRLPAVFDLPLDDGQGCGHPHHSVGGGHRIAHKDRPDRRFCIWTADTHLFKLLVLRARFPPIIREP